MYNTNLYYASEIENYLNYIVFDINLTIKILLMH